MDKTLVRHDMKSNMYFSNDAGTIFKYSNADIECFDKYIEFGKYSYISGDTFSFKWPDINSKVIIGNFCSISTGLQVYFGGNHRIDRVTTFPFGIRNSDIFNKFDGSGHPAISKGPIIIGNDVWIGTNVIIFAGVKIGDGAVIAAESIVTKDVEPYSVCGGNPCKFIKYRFTEEQRNRLLQIKWWDWEDSKINDYTPLLCDDNIDRFINAAL